MYLVVKRTFLVSSVSAVADSTKRDLAQLDIQIVILISFKVVGLFCTHRAFNKDDLRSHFHNLIPK